MTGRERVMNALNRQPVDRIPFSFWFHFLRDEHLVDGVKNPEMMEANFQGHKRYINQVRPDFVKIMTDGLFRYPGIEPEKIKKVADLADIPEVAGNDPWTRANTEHASSVTALSPDLCYFYNVFSPSMLLRLLIGEEMYFKLYHEDAQKFAESLTVMGQGIAGMTKRVLHESGVDGIYYCVQNPNIHLMSDQEYAKWIRPSDLITLDAANSASDNNILHICGYEGRRNHLEEWVGYPSKAVNWAVAVEGVSLAEGQEIFSDRAVMGGFGNTVKDVLYTGPRWQIEDRVESIVTDAGKTGFMVAADCALPFDINWQHLVWVRDKLKNCNKTSNVKQPSKNP